MISLSGKMLRGKTHYPPRLWAEMSSPCRDPYNPLLDLARRARITINYHAISHDVPHDVAHDVFNDGKHNDISHDVGYLCKGIIYYCLSLTIQRHAKYQCVFQYTQTSCETSCETSCAISFVFVHMRKRHANLQMVSRRFREPTAPIHAGAEILPNHAQT